MENIGEKLKRIRIARNKTQQDIADAIGLSRSYYARIENGTKRISVDKLIKLADYYGVTLDYFSNERVEKSFFELLTQISMFFDSQHVSEDDKDAAYQDIMELYLKHKKDNK